MAGWKGQALNYNVVVQRVERKNITESGLDITSSTDKNEKLEQGIVVSVGNLCPMKEVDGKKVPFLNVGDVIVYDKYKATDYTEDGILYKNTLFADIFKVFDIS